MIELFTAAVDAIKELGDGSAQQGIMALGWILAGIFGYSVFSGRKTKDDEKAALETQHKADLKDAAEKSTKALDDERAARTSARDAADAELRAMRAAHEAEIARIRAEADARIHDIEEDLSERLDEALRQIQTLNQAHIQVITDLSDKRIEDFKSVNEDYNKMVDQVRQALEKIASSINKKR